MLFNVTHRFHQSIDDPALSNWIYSWWHSRCCVQCLEGPGLNIAVISSSNYRDVHDIHCFFSSPSTGSGPKIISNPRHSNNIGTEHLTEVWICETGTLSRLNTCWLMGSVITADLLGSQNESVWEGATSHLYKLILSVIIDFFYFLTIKQLTFTLLLISPLSDLDSSLLLLFFVCIYVCVFVCALTKLHNCDCSVLRLINTWPIPQYV